MRAFLVILLATALAATVAPGALGVTATATKFAGGLKHPVDIEWGKDGHLYVAELVSGDVVKLDASGAIRGRVLTLPNLVVGVERGFVGMTLDPQHDGRVWTYYTTGTETDDVNVVSWWKDGRETRVLTVDANPMHNGGRMAFDPTGGSLYVAVGDAANRENAQNLDTLNGKILRIDREGDGVAGNHRDRIVSYGHRNIYGLAVDPATGRVMITENMNGQNDEVNLVRVGGDYGWPHCEGTRATDKKEPCPRDHEEPLFEYPATISPTGGTWLACDFYFTAFNRGDLHRISQDGEGWKDEVVYHHGESPRLLDVTAGPDGRDLYLSLWTVRENPDDSEGQIWRVTLDGLPDRECAPLGGAGDPDDGDPVGPPAGPLWGVPSAGTALLAAGAGMAAALCAAGRRR